MSSQAAQSFWDIPSNLKYDEPIEEQSPFFVDTAEARGNFTFNRIYKSLFLDPVSLSFKSRLPHCVYQLFLGHRGCGKSTELRRLSHTLHHPDRFFVTFLDVPSVLDINNLVYADILLALAAALLEQLDETGVVLEDQYLDYLLLWFDERVEKHESTKEYAADIKTGLQGETGLPFIAKLFAAITTSFRINSTYKEEVRTVVKNSFSQFALAFNALIAAANEQIAREGLGRCLLFVVDGTDRLGQDDSRRFFINDAYQLQQIEGNFIYCAPIQLSHEEGQVNEAFKSLILPMMKLREKHDATHSPTAYPVMREMVYKRIDSSLFDAETTVDILIEHSGGNPRHLIRLLDYAYLEAAGELLDLAAAQKAVKRLGNDLRRILDTTDYPLLKRIDSCDEEINDSRVRHLLYNLALLEYNDYWRLSHPAVRALDAYQRATP